MKKKINVTIDDDLPDKIQKESVREGRSRSGTVNRILRKHFDKDGHKKKKES